MIAAGTYKAKLTDAAFTKSKQGSLLVKLIFRPTGGEYLSWHGSFGTEKAMKSTLKTLINCGLQNAPDDIADKGIAAFQPKEVELEVIHEMYNGKNYAKIKYINAPGQEKLDGNTAKALLSGLNLKDELAILKSEMGIPQAPTQTNFEDF
jgi:hypothetical protein